MEAWQGQLGWSEIVTKHNRKQPTW